MAKKPIVFIQGVHLDGSVWNRTKKEFDTSYFDCTDLDRLGRDESKPASLKEIAQLSAARIPEMSILVAHSYGGAIANAMIGICPKKIAKIIYVTAVGPLLGEKPFDKMSKKDQAAYGTAVTFNPPKIIPKEAKTFFSKTDPSVNLNDSLPHLYPEWISLTEEALEFDTAVFNLIPKAYIHTTQDPVLSTATQRLYVARTPTVSTEELPTGHFPMISSPLRLAELIMKLI